MVTKLRKSLQTIEAYKVANPHYNDLLDILAEILVLREEADGEIKCSLRTTKDNIDVSKLAKRFGGGGHAGAAGFSLRGRLIRTENGWTVEPTRS